MHGMSFFGAILCFVFWLVLLLLLVIDVVLTCDWVGVCRGVVLFCFLPASLQGCVSICVDGRLCTCGSVCLNQACFVECVSCVWCVWGGFSECVFLVERGSV